MDTAENLRKGLTVSSDDFDDIVLGRKLGANSNIHSIIMMLADIADQMKTQRISCGEGRDLALELTYFFDRLRGDSTIAVRNAVDRLTEPLKSGQELDGKVLADALLRSCRQYEEESAGWNKSMIETAEKVLHKVTAIMVYDFSSSVDQVLTLLESFGRPVEIYVPESRTLNGGMPYVRNHRDSGLFFHVIPDCAMAYYVQKCDGALVGVETFCRDGGLYNTTGSLLLALACREFHIPFYGAAQFIKCSREMAESRGNLKKPEEYDMKTVMGLDGEGAALPCMDAVSVGIEFVPARYVTGYLTEMGYVTPDCVEALC